MSSRLKKDGVKTSVGSSTLAAKKKKSTTGITTVSSTTTTTTKRDSSVERSTVRRRLVENRQPNIAPVKVTSKESVKTLKKPTAAPSKIVKASRVEQGVKKSTPTKRDAPVTPPSSRTEKSQFFPSKNMYANALKTTGARKTVMANPNKAETKPVVKKITRGSIKSVREAKKRDDHYNDASSDTSSVSERPRTATLRRGSIVNHNIVGPDAPKPVKIVKQSKPEVEISQNDDHYEDDFESYESDFEAYSTTSSSSPSSTNTSHYNSSSSSTPSPINAASPVEFKTKRVGSGGGGGTDDEKNLDSGNYELPEYKHKQILDNIKESIEKENAKTKAEYLAGASLSDEGFEEAKSLQYINFLDAKKKHEHRKSVELKRRRGEEILSMIRLDTYSFTLFDLAPVPYDRFIRTYGRSNTVQAAVQSGEDDVDEAVQTEQIINANKWTQCPTVFTKMAVLDNPTFWNTYKSEQRGVGCDEFCVDGATSAYSERQLDRFIQSAGGLIVKIYAELDTLNVEKLIANTRDNPYSGGYVKFNTESQAVLGETRVQFINFCHNVNAVLTVHAKKQPHNNANKDFNSIVCLWDISNGDAPKTMLMSYGDITCCTFGLNSTAGELIFGGLRDGTISIWNTSEKTANSGIEAGALVPTYTTAIGLGHSTKIVSLQPFQDTVDKILNVTVNQCNEILSLDEDGELITWDIYTNEGIVDGLKHREKVTVVKKSSISLRKFHPELTALQCTDFIINNLNSNFVYIATNYGFIILYNLNGARCNVKKFSPGLQSPCNCLDICPFSPDYFLAGFDDGIVNLYSRFAEKPLMALSYYEKGTRNNRIEIVQWSRSKPFVVYTKDSTNTVHIWDLQKSDMYPIYSIPFDGGAVTCMKLSPIMEARNIATNMDKKSYMMIGTDDGHLHLHLFKPEYGVQSPEDYNSDRNTFLNYVSRL